MKKYSRILTAWLLILSLAFSDFIFTNASSVLDYVGKTLENVSIYSDDVLSEDDDILGEETPGGGVFGRRRKISLEQRRVM